MREKVRQERFWVYVVELRPKKLLNEVRPKPEVYVGSSALPPEERFHKHVHRTHAKASRHVRNRGVRLLPQLYRHLNPIRSREAVKAAEKQLRRDLERRGYRVYGSCMRSESPTCWL